MLPSRLQDNQCLSQCRNRAVKLNIENLGVLFKTQKKPNYYTVHALIYPKYYKIILFLISNITKVFTKVNLVG